MDNRRAKGFIKSIFDTLKLDLPIPDHTTISRRGRKLNIQRNCVSSRLDEMRRVEFVLNIFLCTKANLCTNASRLRYQ
ncbi:MAG: transposase [Aquificaceae bacterium]